MYIYVYIIYIISIHTYIYRNVASAQIFTFYIYTCVRVHLCVRVYASVCVSFVCVSVCECVSRYLGMRGVPGRQRERDRESDDAFAGVTAALRKCDW